jgi:DNA-binding response OmpR family regulator
MTMGDPPHGVLGRIAPGDPGEEPGVPGASVDVLLVQHDGEFAASICDVLRRRGFTAVVAASGDQAEEALRHGCAPRLVILDLELPGSSVRALVARLREDRGGAGAGYVALTPSPSTDPGALGVDGVVMRPVDAAELLAVVGRHCGRA